MEPKIRDFKNRVEELGEQTGKIDKKLEFSDLPVEERERLEKRKRQAEEVIDRVNDEIRRLRYEIITDLINE